MNTTYLFVYTLLTGLAVVYVYFRYLYKRSSYTQFGTLSRRSDPVAVSDELVTASAKQKLKLKAMAFKFYLFSLLVSFGLGVFMVVLVFCKDLDFSMYKTAFGVAAGTSLTVGFRGLFNTCRRDLEKMGC